MSNLDGYRKSTNVVKSDIKSTSVITTAGKNDDVKSIRARGISGLKSIMCRLFSSPKRWSDPTTTDAIFALRQLQERYREAQQDLHCVLIDLEKANDRVPGEELYWCMRNKGVPEKYIRLVKDM